MRTLFRPAPWLLPLAVVAAVLLPVDGAPDAVADPPERVAVPKAYVRFDDGDSITIHWPDMEEPEAVRILGIDAPEVVHLEHDIPFSQAFGEAAAGFLRGCVAVAGELELLRSEERDGFGRTLGYLFLDDHNYSVLAIENRMAVETVTHFGDNGLPEPAAACLAAAKAAGRVAFEPPYLYRRRMRDVAKQMRAEGTYPGAR